MSINLKKSSHIIFFGGLLPLLSLVLAWSFNQIFPNTPFWLESLSPIYAYALLYSLFDKFVWNWKVFRLTKVVEFPDLRGRWTGTQRSSYKEADKNVEIPAILEIKQTFSKIIVRAYYTKSQSECAVASLAELNGETYLFYTYDNEPNSLKRGTMQAHKGTVKLQYLPKENKLLGFYFNSIGNTGEMKFDYQQSDLLYRFEE
ncbi:MAG: hypothetical protein ABH867_04500 [Patescibacteria group bacterium]